MRSNLFAQVENKFKFATESEITDIAFLSLDELIEVIPDEEIKVKFTMILLGAKLGVAGREKITEKEKRLVDKIFGRIYNGPMEKVYDSLNGAITEKDYDLVRSFILLYSQAALPYLHFILSFAYVDDVFEDDVAERLDGIFGFSLMTALFTGDLDEENTPQIQLVGIEAEIAQWFQSHDELKQLRDIQAHFSHKSKIEVKTALEHLCEKGVLYSIDTFAGNMYGLASASPQVSSNKMPSQPQNTKKETNNVSQIIDELKTFMVHGEQYSASELADTLGYDVRAVSAALRHMKDVEKIVEKEMIRRVAYFSLCE